MGNFSVEQLRQVLEEETESLNRGSADEVIFKQFVKQIKLAVRAMIL